MSNMTQTQGQPLSEHPELVRTDPKWGEDYCVGQVAYVTPDGLRVWMHRKGQRVRYFDQQANQVGPEHKNVYPAVVWASANMWIDPHNVNLSIASIMEIRGQIAEREAMDPDTRLDVETGAWVPVAAS